VKIIRLETSETTKTNANRKLLISLAEGLTVASKRGRHLFYGSWKSEVFVAQIAINRKMKNSRKKILNMCVYM
jgi:hypothetical protein